MPAGRRCWVTIKLTPQTRFVVRGVRGSRTLEVLRLCPNGVEARDVRHHGSPVLATGFEWLGLRWLGEAVRDGLVAVG